MAGLVEKLVNLVGRAFYSDEHIVVLQALIRERFLKDDEMGNAVNLQTRQLRKTMNELHQDHLVCEEVLNDKRLGGSSSTSYWYIDYKYFVEVVQYRLYMMQEHLKENEKLEIERQTYQCKDPDCGREYTALEAQLLLMPGQYNFRCGHCNEILLECDNNYRLERVQALQRKLKDQMNKQAGMHEGIFEVLSRINAYLREGHSLPSNLPSENRAAGIGGRRIRTGGGASGHRPNNGGAGGTGNAGNGSRPDDVKNAQSFLYAYGSHEREIVVDIDGNEQADDDYLADKKRKLDNEAVSQPVKAPRALPEFLQGSSISGHLAAKHHTAATVVAHESTIVAPAHSMSDLANSEMTEEERQEAFKRAYLAELERYNEANKDSEEVEVEVDKKGWDAEMNGDGDEEELEDIEWEWCDEEEECLVEAEVSVRGYMKNLANVDDEDLQEMTDEEFMDCYSLCLSQR